MSTAIVIGGENMFKQVAELRRHPEIIIATPGRLIDLIGRQHLRIDDTTVLVLDEADRMLDMGFAPQIEKILKMIPVERQTLLFSATIPQEIMKIASSYMKLPVHIEMAPSGTTAEKVSQEIFIVPADLKPKLLKMLLDKYIGPVLVFTRTKRGAGKVAHQIKQMRHSAAEIHSDRSLSQRKTALEGFKSGMYRILVATDIAARGIDVTGIELVINYDLPDDPENYVHRIGRTGRAGHAGHAITFAMPDQGSDVNSIEKLIKTNIPRSTHPELPQVRFVEGRKKPSFNERIRSFSKRFTSGRKDSNTLEKKRYKSKYSK